MKNKLVRIKKYLNFLYKKSKVVLKKISKKLVLFLKTNLMVEIFLIVSIINGILLRYFTVKNVFDINRGFLQKEVNYFTILNTTKLPTTIES